jgi:hypothetical protein
VSVERLLANNAVRVGYAEVSNLGTMAFLDDIRATRVHAGYVTRLWPPLSPDSMPLRFCSNGQLPRA